MITQNEFNVQLCTRKHYVVDVVGKYFEARYYGKEHEDVMVFKLYLVLNY